MKKVYCKPVLYYEDFNSGLIITNEKHFKDEIMNGNENEDYNTLTRFADGTDSGACGYVCRKAARALVLGKGT